MRKWLPVKILDIFSILTELSLFKAFSSSSNLKIDTSTSSQ